jgi:hypothetical protein
MVNVRGFLSFVGHFGEFHPSSWRLKKRRTWMDNYEIEFRVLFRVPFPYLNTSSSSIPRHVGFQY